MTEYDILYWNTRNKIEDLVARVQTLKSKLLETIAPAFYGADLSRERFEVMLQSIPKSDQLTVFVPVQNVYLKMWFGDGTNMDTLCEGCDNYIMYNLYDSDFEEIDGGMMEFNNYASHYVDDIRRAAVDVVDFACGRMPDGRIVDFIPLTTSFT